ncbi:MAG TPA: amidohydrolase family protein [Phycisphaerales bacterium]|nr:amidohydrolase family protein [Phycisphaerales bacterium]
MREAHAHLIALGEALAIPDLADCAGLDDCLARVGWAAAGARAGPQPAGRAPFVRLSGARVEAWPERRWPTMEELDRSGGGVPTVVLSFDHHAACANSAALRAAGLEPGAPVGAAGIVATDEAGLPTGLLLEDAAFRAWQAADPAEGEAALEQLAAAVELLRDLGFDEAHDLNSQPELGPRLAELERRGRLGMRIRLYPPAARVREASEEARGWASDRVELAGAKVFADGTLNSRTAFMLEEYREPLAEFPRGRALLAPDDLDDAAARAASVGLPLAVHAIGDGAVRLALDAIERAQRGGVARAVCRGLRYRVEHCELIDPGDVPRFAALGVVCSVQPCHLLADVEALTRYLPHRLERVLPLRDLVAAGCAPGELLWFGSDVPIVRADPRDSIVAATLRRRPDMPAERAIGPRQALSATEAWACFAGAPAGPSPGACPPAGGST